jgi:hypothetical protein
VSPTLQSETLRRVIDLAGRAPSVHNTQPWVWRRTATGLELHVDSARRLRAADPLGRNAVMSCGATLHHLTVAAAALGWESQVRRVPDPSGSSLLAQIELRPCPPSADAATDLRAIAERCTDRRRFTSWPVPDEPLHRLAAIASLHGTQAVPLLAVTERFRAELLVRRAIERQCADQRIVLEQEHWVDHSAASKVPVCHGHVTGGSPSDTERLIEGSDGLLVLCGESDDVASWLSAGEGLSALWLAATTQGLSVVPLSQVVEVAETREALRHEVLGGLAHPLLLVRIGWQEISRSQLPRTARRPVDDILDHADPSQTLAEHR